MRWNAGCVVVNTAASIALRCVLTYSRCIDARPPVSLRNSDWRRTLFLSPWSVSFPGVKRGEKIECKRCLAMAFTQYSARRKYFFLCISRRDHLHSSVPVLFLPAPALPLFPRDKEDSWADLFRLPSILSTLCLFSSLLYSGFFFTFISELPTDQRHFQL